VKERPFDRRNSYIAFCDPSGGSSDSMTLGIAHKEGETVVLDLLREYRPPFSPETVFYLNLVPLINSGSIALLDNERMMLQLVSLERKTSSVKDRVDHPQGMHDDLANAAAGAIVMRNKDRATVSSNPSGTT
jgi:hypothetical protein